MRIQKRENLRDMLGNFPIVLFGNPPFLAYLQDIKITPM
jgi:hypothetical protein